MGAPRMRGHGLLPSSLMVEHHPHGNFVFVPYMTTSASTNRYMGCKIWRSVIARISDKTIRTRATICQGRSMFLLPANNPQQSWGFEGEPPEAVTKDSGARVGTS